MDIINVNEVLAQILLYCTNLLSSELLGAELFSEQLPLHAPVILGIS